MVPVLSSTLDKWLETLLARRTPKIATCKGMGHFQTSESDLFPIFRFSVTLPVLSDEKRRRGYDEDGACFSPGAIPIQPISVDGGHRPTGLCVPLPLHSSFRAGGSIAVYSDLNANTTA